MVRLTTWLLAAAASAAPAAGLSVVGSSGSHTAGALTHARAAQAEAPAEAAAEGSAAGRKERDVDLVQEAEGVLGAFDARKSLAAIAVVQKFRSSAWMTYIETEEPTVAEIFYFGVFYLISSAIYAAVYRKFIQKDTSALEALIEDQRRKEEFEYDLFSFSKCNAELVLCSCCCMCIRWPLTVEKTGMMSFWPAFLIFTCLEGFSGILFGTLLILRIGMEIYFRQQLRLRYGLPQGDAGTCIMDCLAWTFCCCFAGAQEAKQVEYVRPEIVVGAPVMESNAASA